MKTCTKCKAEMSVEEFSYVKANNRLHSWCKVCLAEYSSRYRKVNPKKVKESRRLNRVNNPEKTCLSQSRASAKKLGYAPCTASVEELKAALTGRCHICGVPEIECARKLHLDHDHISGNFRGWLCKKCNTAIGMLGDSKEILAVAINYLENSSKKVKK